MGYGITLGGVDNLDLLQSDQYLMAYTDSDYAACQDTRRCIGGFITMLYKSPISWVSRRHHIVVLSTTEAEYIALCYCMQELIYIKLLLRELGCESSKPTLIMEDNQSCIKIYNNPELHGRSKHIDIKYFFVQEKVTRKEFTISYCNTNAMCADIFIKPLAKPLFEKIRELLRDEDRPPSEAAAFDSQLEKAIKKADELKYKEAATAS
ncbi:Polyprotein [Phytophthora palmivora]|uniref:Polyprotein n=1 Tax=Phytophthora palmivora TaxID=4796 RepID=A0A2P4XVZ2_9STRA|nr:Polyprotein [Phytophthora palmivora]